MKGTWTVLLILAAATAWPVEAQVFGPVPETLCADGQDNDRDNQVDCSDPDCSLYASDNACSKETLCQNGVDDDQDRLTDCGDKNCHVYTGVLGGRCRGENDDSCGDNIDNDGDTKIDCADSDCAGVVPCTTPSPTFFPGYPYCSNYGYYNYGYYWGWCTEHCADGVDNDGDSQIDCADPQCMNWNGEVPTCPLFMGEAPGLQTCGDRADNDNDGLIDCMEDACAATHICKVEYSCANNFDDDRDGQWDCKDGDCSFNTYCSIPEACNDREDNDGDQAIDCEDLDCGGSEACTGAIFPSGGLVGRAATGTSGALAVAAGVGAAASVATAAASAQSGPEFLRSLLPFSALHRRQTPWGRVVEAHSNRPITGALLALLDEGGKVRATERSRRDGTFGFFVPPGTYRIVSQRSGYQFPAPAPEIALFPGETVYDGGWMPVTEESVLTLVVVGQALSHTPLTSVAEKARGVWTRVQVWQARLAMPLLLIGAGLAALTFWNNPGIVSGALIGVYLLLLTLELLLSRVARRAVGNVRDITTKKGVGLAVVRLVDQVGRLVATRVTLENGHFFLMPQPGRYRLEVAHPNYELYTKDPFRVRKFFFGVASARAKLIPR